MPESPTEQASTKLCHVVYRTHLAAQEGEKSYAEVQARVDREAEDLRAKLKEWVLARDPKATFAHSEGSSIAHSEWVQSTPEVIAILTDEKRRPDMVEAGVLIDS